MASNSISIAFIFFVKIFSFRAVPKYQTGIVKNMLFRMFKLLLNDLFEGKIQQAIHFYYAYIYQRHN